MHLDLAHSLRSGRNVFVPKDPNTEKLGPMQFKKGERAVPDLSWLTPTCAKVALEHYNRLNEEDEHELVKATDSIVIPKQNVFVAAKLAQLKSSILLGGPVLHRAASKDKAALGPESHQSCMC
ncbi:hypothetical protein EJB05_03360, partial [Eragrostis curvula]